MLNSANNAVRYNRIIQKSSASAGPSFFSQIFKKCIQTARFLPVRAKGQVDNHDRLLNEPLPYDAATHEKLTGDHIINEPEEKQVISGPRIEIVTKNGGTVNVRVGNGTEYEIIKEVETGAVLEYIATAGNGWNAVKVETQVGWVSGEYSKLK